jgi:hypothetical protein
MGNTCGPNGFSIGSSRHVVVEVAQVVVHEGDEPDPSTERRGDRLIVEGIGEVHQSMETRAERA